MQGRELMTVIYEYIRFNYYVAFITLLRHQLKYVMLFNCYPTLFNFNQIPYNILIMFKCNPAFQFIQMLLKHNERTNVIKIIHYGDSFGSEAPTNNLIGLFRAYSLVNSSFVIFFSYKHQITRLKLCLRCQYEFIMISYKKVYQTLNYNNLRKNQT